MLLTLVYSFFFQSSRHFHIVLCTYLNNTTQKYMLLRFPLRSFFFSFDRVPYFFALEPTINPPQKVNFIYSHGHILTKHPRYNDNVCTTRLHTCKWNKFGFVVLSLSVENMILVSRWRQLPCTYIYLFNH